MHHTDPMGYTLEQLVRALAAETITELSYDDSEIEEEYVQEQGYNLWESIAETVFKEISDSAKINESSAVFSPYGRDADELLEILQPVLEPYSQYPAAPKLLAAMEKIISSKHGLDPRPYTAFVVRVMNSDAAKLWNSEGRVYR